MIKIKFNEFVKYDIFINYNPFTIKKISLFKLEQGKVRKKKSQTLIWVRKKVRSLFNNLKSLYIFLTFLLEIKPTSERRIMKTK